MAESADNTALRVGLLAPVESLDPRGAWEMGRALVASQIFETPYAVRGSSLEAEPLLFEGAPAREPSSPAGKRVLSARLRSGIRFSDGSELTVDEAAAILARSDLLLQQARVEAREGRICFELHRPNARFDLTLTLLDCAIVRERNGTLIGTGPYAFDAQTEDGEIRLIRNPHRGKVPAIPEVRFVVYPPDADGRPTALLEALEQGEVDFTNVLSLDHQNTLRGVRKHAVPGNSTAILFFNAERLRDASLRRAIATAIDRRAIARMLYSDPITITNQTAKGLVPPMLGSSLDGIIFDLKKARELLELARDPIPKKLNLLVIWSPRAYLPQPRQVGDALARQLSEIGLSVDVEMSQGAEDLTRRIGAGSFDLYLGGWIADTPDPADFLAALLSSQAIPGTGGGAGSHANFSRWRRTSVDDTLERLRAEQSQTDQARVLMEVAEEVPVFPLLCGPATTAHSRKLQGFSLSAIGHPSFAALRFAV